MFNFVSTLQGEINQTIIKGAKNRLTDEEFIVNEIRRFLASKRRNDMLNGENYYLGHQDILFRKRTVIGQDGKIETVDNLPNNRIIDNQYRKMVNQKVNYLLGQPITVQTDNERYAKNLKTFLSRKFLRLMKNIGRDSLNCGVGWLFLYYDEYGEFSFKRLKPYEVIPGWRDEEHTILDYAIRIFEMIVYNGKQEEVIEKVEVYDQGGVYRFILDGGRLIPDEIPHENYFTIEEQGYNWQKIPLIPFKYNSYETPLIRGVKSLQDGLNLILSNFQNGMEEDTRNTILVLVNYDGENLGEFRKNLSTYGAIKVRNDSGASGDVRTLQIEVNAENYKTILELFKKAIIENAMGYDAKDDRLSGNPNQMNIQSMYSDIDLDANEMETEYQASFEELLFFINLHLANTGMGDLEGEQVEIIFNRDILISEAEVIDNVQKSVGILSTETLIANHPWVDDPQKELDRVKQEKEETMEEFGDTFNTPANNKLVTTEPPTSLNSDN